MAEQVLPDDLIATPIDVAESFHRIVQGFRSCEVDFLVLKLPAIEQPLDGSESIDVANHGGRAMACCILLDFPRPREGTAPTLPSQNPPASPNAPPVSDPGCQSESPSLS